MKPTRIVLALALAVVAAPAFAQATSDDGGLSSGALAVLLLAAPPAAPNALAAPPKSDAPSAAGGHGPGKLRDATGTPSMSEDMRLWDWRKKAMDGGLKKPESGLNAAALPQPSGAGGAGKVQVQDLFVHGPRTTPPVPAVRFDVVGSPTEVINTGRMTKEAKVVAPALPQMQPGAPALRR
jgi:hypothetical protein